MAPPTPKYQLPDPWKKLHPAVPRRWLLLFAGLVWIAVGLLLLVRTLAWIEPLSVATLLILEGIGVALASGGYVYGFSGIVKRNIARIHALPERVCAFAFTAWKGYFMIALMVTIGITLRNSEIPKVYLVVPYTAMGGMLLAGSRRFLAEFMEGALPTP